jgi:diphthamide synthase (EF-2-diphthine--ammonia ligase)
VMTRPQAWMSWSSGKDSTLALHRIRAVGEVEVVGLLTTLNSTADRVAMHAVRRELLEAQAISLGLPLHVVELPWPCPNAVYEQQMTAALETANGAGVTQMVFGDLFLEDIRTYRETQLAGTGITAVFPLWGEPTAALAAEMLDAGISAVVTCVDPAHDEALLRALPSTVDPCGKRGEFHTFVANGPGFTQPLAVTIGEIVRRDGFVFADLLPGTAA